MELILIQNNGNKSFKLSIDLLGALFIGLFVLALTAGTFHIGSKIVAQQAEILYLDLNAKKENQWRHELDMQQANIDVAKRNAENSLDALSVRLSTLQAHLLRLDALGSRIVSIANMSDDEFNMLESPGLGGPLSTTEQTSLGVTDFVKALHAVSQKIEDRSDKFAAMESMLLDSNVQSQISPEGSPVAGGWTSSLFGWRADPISGKKVFHEGIDLAGKYGKDVSSVAAGIVTWSGRNSGYGEMIEISHGNGYITRYAHNQQNLVDIGDKIEKGQKIATMGSSGRSTGPHIHFEVMHNGRPVNPRKFISIN